MTDNLPTAASLALDFSSEEVLHVIRTSVCQDATDAELAFFIQYCKSSGLNPFKREAWFVKTKGYTRRSDGVEVPGKVQIMTGINGYFAIANKHPQFDGMDEPQFEHDEKGNIVKCTVKVYRKDRRIPSTGVAFWKEYFAGNEKKTSNWDTKPHHMIAKIAKAIALREAFPQELNGTYVEEEGDQERAESADYEARIEAIKAEEIERQKKEAAARAAAQIHYYDLKEMPEASADRAKDYLQKAGADFDMERGVWVSPRDLPKLQKYEVHLPEVNHA